MSIDILKMLIQSACSEGSVSEQDKSLLVKKAKELGISDDQLDKMIQEELSKQAGNDSDDSSGFITSTNEEDNQVKDNKSSGFVTKEVKKEIDPPSAFSDVRPLDSQGAMSSVYQGKLHGKWIIIKRVKPEFKNDPKYISLFYKEFENAYHLDHPNIIRLLDKGEDAQGAYYTMEYVDGRPLSNLMGNNGIKDERLIKKIFTQMLDALIYVHKKQIVHRDLKPDNILITYRGDNVKILDFGLAAADSFEDNLAKVGTPKYAAPEQMTKGYDADQRADIYALGLILLEMITGSITDKEAKNVKNLNYQYIINKCLQQKPEDRFYDCTEIQEALNKPISKPKEEKAELSQVDELKNEADTAFNTNNYNQAKQLYSKLLALKPNDQYAINQIDKCNNALKPNEDNSISNKQKKKAPLIPIIIGAAVILIIVVGFIFRNKIFGDPGITDNQDSTQTENNQIDNVTDKFSYHKKRADSLFQAQHYLLAKQEYEKALKHKTEDVEVLNSIRKTDNIIRLRKEADNLYNNKNVARAVVYYDSILVIVPKDKIANDQKQKCNNIINNSELHLLDEKRSVEAGTQTQRLGLVNNDGYVIVDYLFDDIGREVNKNILPVKRNGKWGAIDNTKKIVLKCEYRYHAWIPKGYKFSHQKVFRNPVYVEQKNGETVVEK